MPKVTIDSCDICILVERSGRHGLIHGKNRRSDGKACRIFFLENMQFLCTTIRCLSRLKMMASRTYRSFREANTTQAGSRFIRYESSARPGYTMAPKSGRSTPWIRQMQGGKARIPKMICAEQNHKAQSIPCSNFTDLVTEAERELTAYLIAVKEVHGPHSVNMAAEHWMQALDEICLSNLNPKESFRRVTFSAISTLCP